MEFFRRLISDGWADWTPWLVIALVATTALIRALSPGDLPRVRMLAILTGLHVVSIVVAAAMSDAYYDPTPWEITALAFALLAAVGMGSLVLFRVFLPRIGLPVPRILTDLFAAAGFIVVMIVVGRRAGFSVAGLITTSAVVTAVIGFSLQDTLGNIMGGLALQLDNSIRVGDWVALNYGQVNGKVTEIRWRYTALETRNWETLIVPNSVLADVERHADHAHADVVRRELRVPRDAQAPRPRAVYRRGARRRRQHPRATAAVRITAAPRALQRAVRHDAEHAAPRAAVLGPREAQRVAVELAVDAAVVVRVRAGDVRAVLPERRRAPGAFVRARDIGARERGSETEGNDDGGDQRGLHETRVGRAYVPPLAPR